MSMAEELIRAVEANGGHLRVDGEDLVIAPRKAAAPVIDELRLHKAEIIDLLKPTSIPPVDPADLYRADFVAWIDANCIHRPTCDDWTSISRLYIGFAEGQTTRGYEPCSRAVFEQMLMELGCRFCNGMVSGFLLREDLEAVLNFQAAPVANGPPERAAAGRRRNTGRRRHDKYNPAS